MIPKLKSTSQDYINLSVRKTALLFSGRLMPVLILFAIFILFSRKLSYSDYGEFQSMWMYVNLINVVISFGLSSVIFSTNLNFLSQFLKDNKRKIFLFYSILAIVTYALFLLFASNVSIQLKVLLIAFTIIQTVASVLDSLLIKKNGEKISLYINTIYSLLFFGWHFYILETHYSLFNLVVGITCISVLKGLSTFWALPRKIDSGFFQDSNNFLSHWIFLGLNDIFGIFSKWLDKLFLVFLVSAADFAIFFNGSFEIPLIGLLISVAGIFLTTEISANLNDLEKAKRIFRNTFDTLSSIVFPLFFFLFFFRSEIFSLVFQNKYQDSLPIFVISIFILPLRINNYTVILQCFSKGNIILRGAIWDVLIAALFMVILYPIMGSKGLALAIVISTALQSAYYIWHSAQIINMKTLELIPLKILLIKITSIAAIFIAFYFLINALTPIMKISAGMILTLIITLWQTRKYISPIFRK